MAKIETTVVEESSFVDVQFRTWPTEDALSIASGLTAVLNAFTCPDKQKEIALEMVLKLHMQKSLERAREQAGL